jgi:diguanylate cyclase (GGDEF)-like protein
VEVADRLRDTLRLDDELARMGGYEYTILWNGVADARDAEGIAERLLATMDEPFAVPGGATTLGISVGIALAGPGATADSLLSAADAALYESKKRGGSLGTVRL